ncbi:MAG: hypothetical protein IPN84_03545 [Sphingomonadales bacterium]|nr:hypothetical protein [Sphingomonadales bacterium]
MKGFWDEISFNIPRFGRLRDDRLGTGRRAKDTAAYQQCRCQAAHQSGPARSENAVEAGSGGRKGNGQKGETFCETPGAAGEAIVQGRRQHIQDTDGVKSQAGGGKTGL